VFAISPSNDLLIAGAARTGRWRADLYINNPGETLVSVDVMWLERGQANLNPVTEDFDVFAGETLILEDVLSNNFGMNRAEGAFRITATGGVVTANLIVFTGAGSPDGTYGSGFEAIPASAATSADEFTNLMGVALNSSFYTNLFALAGASGVTMDVDLLDTDGGVLDTAQVVLEAYEPWLATVADLWDVASFDNGTAHVRVSEGSMVMLGSKVDRASNDPTTLEQEFGSGGGSVDGTYQFAIYEESGYATGGNLEIVDGLVDFLFGTFANFEKDEDADEDPDCPSSFLFVHLIPTPVEDFETGVEFPVVYDPEGDFEGGTITYTMMFTVDDNLGFSGTVAAVGSDFAGIDAGCNGTFPPLNLFGGKSEVVFGGKSN
jgi:hypothetical protein